MYTHTYVSPLFSSANNAYKITFIQRDSDFCWSRSQDENTGGHMRSGESSLPALDLPHLLFLWQSDLSREWARESF